MGRAKWWLLILFLIAAALLSMLVSMCLGPVNIPIGTTFDIYRSRYIDASIPVYWTETQQNIVLELRLPRAIVGMVSGMSLAVCGIGMQTLVRNPIADPYILGVSSGASLTAMLGLMYGFFPFITHYKIPITAFMGAIATIAIVYILSTKKGKLDIFQLLMIGMVFAMVAKSLIYALKTEKTFGATSMAFWMSGSLASAQHAYVGFPLLIIIPCITFMVLRYRVMNLMLMGEETAITLGVNIRREQSLLMIVTSLLTGVTISISGSIGFVGLVVPHFARYIVGPDNKRLIPTSALCGGILVTWVDVLARLVLAPEEIPVGVLTAIIGGPLFIYMVKRDNIWR